MNNNKDCQVGQLTKQVQTLTSRTIQTNHRESKGKIFDEKSFAKIGGHHQLLFRGSALKPQQAAFGKVAQSTNLSLDKCLFLCPIDDVCVFSVLDLVKRLLTKVVRMSTAKGPQPNSTFAADRNKVTKSLV